MCVSVWWTGLSRLRYVSLFGDKHCHLSLVGTEEVTRGLTATFPGEAGGAGGGGGMRLVSV